MHGTTAKVMVTLAASGWTAVLAIVTTPIAVKFLGVEAYGLLGLFASLQVVLSLLDFGIGATQTRELARLPTTLTLGLADPANIAAARHLARTHEIIYLGLALVATLLLLIAAPAVARHWVQPGTIAQADIARALRIAALALGAQWLSTLYGAGLAGLHRQTLLATVSLPVATIRAAGPLLALWLVAPTLEVFFITQAVLGLCATLLLRTLFWRAMPASPERTTFRWSAVKGTLGFSAGMSAVSITAVMLTQADKLLLSALLPLEQFGYYMLASALANGINQIVGPIFGTMYPRLSQIVATGDRAALSETFHATAQFLAVAVLPIAAVLAFFPAEALFAWTGNPEVAARGRLILGLLAVAAALNGLMSVLFMLEIAQGRTAPAIWSHSLLLAAMLPLTYVCVLRFGALGGAMGWLALNCAMLALRPPISLHPLPRGDLRLWWLADVAWPAFVTLGTGACLAAILPFPQSRLALVAVLGTCWLMMTLAAAASAPRVWHNAERILLRLRPIQKAS